MTPEKICHVCKRTLRCVMNGADVYLGHTGDTHCGDLFLCFNCLIFSVFGLNMRPLKLWKGDDRTDEITPTPDVVVASPGIVTPYGEGSEFAFVLGEVIPLPSAIWYMKEKCHHKEEIEAYLKRMPSACRAAWRMEK